MARVARKGEGQVRPEADSGLRENAPQFPEGILATGSSSAKE